MTRTIDPFTLIATAFCALMVVFLSTIVPFRLVESPTHTVLPQLEAIQVAGWVLIALGTAGYLFCLLSFIFVAKGPPLPGFEQENLMVNGLYRLTRNPMYICWFAVLLGEAIHFRSQDLLFYLGFWFLFFHGKILLFEEPALRKRYGESYARYCATVPRWIPRIPGLRRKRTQG